MRSQVDGNTTDGDGGALYADEDGDITVVDSTVNGSTADGPGGAIFTLDGDVTIVDSMLDGNRADDRGGAISGEADVTVIGSTIARNAAVAHVGGGIWARGDPSSRTRRSATTTRRGTAAASSRPATQASRIRPSPTTRAGGRNVGAGDRLVLFGSLIGPPGPSRAGRRRQRRPSAARPRSSPVDTTGRRTDVPAHRDGDVRDGGDPLLDPLFANGGMGETQIAG